MDEVKWKTELFFISLKYACAKGDKISFFSLFLKKVLTFSDECDRIQKNEAGPRYNEAEFPFSPYHKECVRLIRYLILWDELLRAYGEFCVHFSFFGGIRPLALTTIRIYSSMRKSRPPRFA